MNIEELTKLAAKHNLTSEPPMWDNMKIDPDGYVYVPQCSYLGDSLVSLADTYEGSGDFCLLIQEALRHLPALLRERESLLRVREAAEKARPAIAELLSGLDPEDRPIGLVRASRLIDAALASYKEIKQ